MQTLRYPELSPEQFKVSRLMRPSAALWLILQERRSSMTYFHQ